MEATSPFAAWNPVIRLSESISGGMNGMDAFESVLMDLTQSSASTSLASLSGWQRPDVVVHLAAHAKVHELVLDPQRALANMVMTHNVLEYCRRAEVPIVFSSSREVYGDIEQHCATEEDADFASCESPYSASKIACEALIYSYARCYDLPFLVCRLSNVYGRYDSDLHRMARVVPWFIHQIFNDEPITVFGPEKVLDFTYVDDCVAALMSGIERLGDGRIKNETVNVASGVGHSLQELAGYVASFAGKEPQVAWPLLAQAKSSDTSATWKKLECRWASTQRRHCRTESVTPSRGRKNGRVLVSVSGVQSYPAALIRFDGRHLQRRIIDFAIRSLGSSSRN